MELQLQWGFSQVIIMRFYIFTFLGKNFFFRLVANICGTNRTDEIETDVHQQKCEGFRIHPSHLFYPLHPQEFQDFFSKNASLEKNLDTLRYARTVHMWNAASIRTSITIGDGTFYELMAKKVCPKVYAQLKNGDVF